MEKLQKQRLIKYLTSSADWIEANPIVQTDEQFTHWQQMVLIANGDPSITNGDIKKLSLLQAKHKEFTDWYKQASVEAKVEMMTIFKENETLSHSDIAVNMRQAAKDIQTGPTRSEAMIDRSKKTYPEIAEIAKKMRSMGVSEEKVTTVQSTLSLALSDNNITTSDGIGTSCWGPSGEYAHIKRTVENAGGKFEATNEVMRISVGNAKFQITPTKGIGGR